MKIHSYTQEPKKIVRKDALEQAVSYLTKERNISTISRRDYVRSLRDSVSRISANDIALKLSDGMIERWEIFYDSIVGEKKPEHLKVAYLCGPQPLNDLKTLVALGILPENVWAFEADDTSYQEAIAEALYSQYPYLKIIKENIETFFTHTPIRFDIIYFDSCGPLPNRNTKQKNLSVLTTIFSQHVLNSPGVLITNFSLPSSEQDEPGRKLLTELVASYLYPKDFLEAKDEDGNEFMAEGPICMGYELSEYFFPDEDDDELGECYNWSKEVFDKLDDYYGQYITRLIMDIAAVIIPYQKFASSSKYISHFFPKLIENQTYSKKIRAIIEASTMSPVNWQDENYHDIIEQHSLIYAFSIIKHLKKNEKQKDYYNSFFKQLSCTSNIQDFLLNMAIMSFIMEQGEKQTEFYSDSLRELKEKWTPHSEYSFCDVFLFHQLLEAWVRQLSVPYQLNIEKTRRWTYKAKETRMFTDLLLFDECRYVYDWMPTIDMWLGNRHDIDLELSFRFALDALAKHARWYYNDDFFSGANVVATSLEGFDAPVLKKRVIVN